MKYTNNYRLNYFEQGDYTDSKSEAQRWETIDTQLKSLFSILGNGILTGWDIVAGTGLTITISPGSGHVNFVAVESTQNYTISGLAPSTTNYIYAVLTLDSYWSKNVGFSARASLQTDDTSVYLGSVVTTDSSVQSISTTGRTTLGFQSLITSLVAAHHHTGGTDSPQPINLATDVQGTLNQNSIPNLDTSKITTGVLDINRIPELSHIDNLTDTGTLTHAQLDSAVETLSIADNYLMGETSTINLLQLVLGLKHAYPDIDQYLVNEIAYIPGISPDDYVDWNNTTATVDILPSSGGGTHTITGTTTGGMTTATRIWDDDEDFSSGTYSDVLISGNAVTLDVTKLSYTLDNFSDLTTWSVITNDLSSVTSGLVADPSDFVNPPQSGKLVIGNTEVEMALTIQKTFTPQDWTDYKYISFYIKTDNIEHGDVYFYLNDSVAGVQNSYVKVLEKNAQTINADTLQNGWQEVVIDITPYTRTSISQIAFYFSTQDGWDTSKGFDFKIDTVVLSSGNIFDDNGYFRVVFGNPAVFYSFWRTRWDAVIPTDSESTGVELKCRVRMANTIPGLSTATWGDYTTVSGTVIVLPPATLYKYIEIEMYFGASNTKTRSALLTKLYLDYNVSSTTDSFTFDTKTEWETGSLYNIDTATTAGTIKVSNTSDIGTYYYGTNGKAIQIDSSFAQMYASSGTSFPKTTYQAINSLTPSLGLLTGISRGNNGNLWVSDVDNDRIVEMDKYGQLIRGFYGSFLSAPYDPYGTEESGPGSNVDITTFDDTYAAPTELNVLHSIYNPDTGVLYIVFDNLIENVNSSTTKLDPRFLYIKSGTQRVYLSDATFELVGVDNTKTTDWYGFWNIATYGQYIKQFQFFSHVLKATLSGANKSLLNYIVNQTQPSLTIASPYQYQKYIGQDVTVKLSLANFVLGSIPGENSIRVRIDGGGWTTVFQDSISYVGLTYGSHTFEAQLVDASGNPYTNIEAVATVTFNLFATAYALPYLYIETPKQNQIYSSSPVTVEFGCENFSITPSSQHIRYVVDSDPPVDHYSTEDIILEDLDPGQHTVQLYTCDQDGDIIVYAYGNVTTTFIVGQNSNAYPILYVDRGAIYDKGLTVPVSTSRTYLDVGNVTFCNIYSPIDVQIIPYDEDGLANGQPSIVVAKLRSPSWNSALASSARALELANRLAKDIPNSTVTLNTDLASYSNIDLIYDTKYMDGHSVAQFDMDGNLIFSNNAAIFAPTKDVAKDTLGSAQKVGGREVLIADAQNKRAIITYTDLITQVPFIEWEYDSDRYITDFRTVSQNTFTINVYDDTIDIPNAYVRQGMSVIWVNSSSSPITIYSGTTTYDIFYQDPDVTLYGSNFYSTSLSPGETYTYKFVSQGTFDWFAYPDIFTGSIHVTNQRLSENDQYYILENDREESPFSSRLIKVDVWGNVIFSFGEGFIVNPRDVRPMLNGNLIIST